MPHLCHAVSRRLSKIIPLETSISNQNINRSILEQVYDYCRKKDPREKKLDIPDYVHFRKPRVRIPEKPKNRAVGKEC
jgi:hypothetical protein